MKETDIAEEYHKNINFLVLKSGLRKSQIARATGISAPALTEYCKKSIPSSIYLYRLAKFFNVTMDGLFGVDNTVTSQRIQYECQLSELRRLEERYKELKQGFKELKQTIR